MNRIDELQKRWRNSAALRDLHAAMTLRQRDLVIGAGTVLANRSQGRTIILAGNAARLLTLLSIARGLALPPSVLGKPHRASMHARAGDGSMAAMHIALALPAPRDPAEASRRVFIADALLADGVRPRDICSAFEFGPSPLDELERQLAKFDPDEPRVPAGSGRPGICATRQRARRAHRLTGAFC